MWFKEAIAACIFALLLCLELYNGLYVYKMDGTLYFQIQGLCELLLGILILLRPKGILRLFIAGLVLVFAVEFTDEIRTLNFELNVSDYTIPLIVFLTIGGIVLLRRYHKQKKAL